MFGPHLIVDGSGCNKEKLADRILIEQVLHDYPAAIGMTKIGGPYIFDYQAPDPAYSGVSGFVIIAESHIAIHTFPELDYFTLDIFSCRSFDPEVAIEYIQQVLEVQQMDRILLQRGLSFRGPHHGPFSVAEAGLQRESLIQLAKERNQSEESSTLRSPIPSRNSWPTFGKTPDYGTYGEAAAAKLASQSAPDPSPPHSALQRGPRDVEPIQINPTISVSGLLDKMSSAGGQVRALGRAVAIWERMVRDSQMHILLALSTLVIAEGMREELVYALEHHFVDTIALSAEDLLVDLQEVLGKTDTALCEGSDDSVPTSNQNQAALTHFTRFIRTRESKIYANSSDLWRELGDYLQTCAPRKGVVQTAAAAGIRLFTPDLGTSTFGIALLSLRARGVDVHAPLDLTQEVTGLAHELNTVSRLGLIRVGAGPADALSSSAREVASSMSEKAPVVAASISLGAVPPLAQTEQADHHETLSTSADIFLSLALTALAQRTPNRQRLRVQQ